MTEHRIKRSAARLAAASLLALAALGIQALSAGPVMLVASALAGNSAGFVSQSVPSSLQPGEQANVSITMLNTGDTAWTAEEGYKLGTQNPQDNTLWTGGTRIYIPDGVSVAPDEAYTFEFTITAPSDPGTYNFQWRMVQEGVEWFGAYTRNTTITVEAPTNGSEFVDQSVPATLAPSQSVTVSITMRNTGSTRWTTADGYRLGTESPRDNTLWTGATRVALPGPVDPGGEAVFRFSVTAPSAPGDYDFQWRMVQDPVEWFGEFTPRLVIHVASPPQVNDAEFVSQDVPESLAPGENATARVTMRNTGNTTWSEEAEYRLGSQNPQDNTLWNSGRIRLPAGVSVAPGGTHTFEFSITAPTTPGNYDFQWRMLQERVEWFGAYTPDVAIVVGDPGPLLTPTPTATRCFPRDDCLPPYDAEIVSDTIPTTMIVGRSYTVQVTVRNAGRNTWTRDEGYMLGAVDDDDPFASELRIWLPPGVEVHTDETYTFEFEMTPPGYATTLLTDWRMVREGVRWFGEMIRYSVRVVYSVPIPSSTPCAPGGPCPPTPTPPLPGGWLPFPIRPGLWPASAEESRPGDIDGDGIPQLTELQLAQHFFPTIWYDGGEDCTAPGGNPGHPPNLPGRLVFRVRPHPERPEAIAISFALLYARDCGDTASPSHNGDVEPFAITIEPMAACPTGYGIRAIRTWAHEGTSAEHVDDIVFPVPRCDFGFSIDPTGRSDVVLASENKHGNYLSLDSCESGDVWMDHCSLTFTAGDVNAWVGFNAGEPGVPRHRDLGLIGFPGEQMWSGRDFCGSLGPDSGLAGCPGPVENKMSDDFVAPSNFRHPIPEGTSTGTAVPRRSATPTASRTASPTSTPSPTTAASSTPLLAAPATTSAVGTAAGEPGPQTTTPSWSQPELLLAGTPGVVDLASQAPTSPPESGGDAVLWIHEVWDEVTGFIDRLLDAWVRFWLEHMP
jgi:hypothetical protein